MYTVTYFSQFAGSDTTSISIAWVFHFLALYPEVQDQLRDELTALRPDPLSQEDPLGFLDLLPLLDAVVRETLRLHAAVPSTIRIATKDDLIPVNEPYKDKYGNIHNGIK